MPILRTVCTLATVIAALGCGAEPAAVPGTTRRSPETRSPAPRPAQPLWAERTRVRDWALVPDQSFLSRGHPGRWTTRIRVPPELRSAYLARAPSFAFPIGTLLVAELTADGGGPGPSLVMSKRDAATWDFFEVDADGRIDSRSAMACARCHAEAPHDQVYGVPGQAPSSAASSTPP